MKSIINRRIYVMGDNNIFSTFQESSNNGCFKEAVCIDAFRVYDSCAEQ